VGAALVATGLAMLANWRARVATRFWVSWCASRWLLSTSPFSPRIPAYIDVGMNYFADTLFFGGALLVLVGSIQPEYRERSAVAEPIAAKFPTGK
jgi:hypothetical protein